MKSKESPIRLLAFFLPGFLWRPPLAVFCFIRSLLKMPGAIRREVRSHPVASSAIGICLLAGVSLAIFGIEHRAQTLSSDAVKYNEAVRGTYIWRVETDPQAYCYAVDFAGGEAICPSKEKVSEIVLNKRIYNLAQKDKFAELAIRLKDPRISSRALYDMGTAYLGDAIDFQDIQSLEDSILALQNSLRDDPSHRDSFDKGSMTLAQDKRINLEIALRIREAVKEGSGQGEGEGEGEDGNLPGGFGAGKSNSGRQP